MPLSTFAQRLLDLHAKQPQAVFYGVDLLGGMFYEKDISRLDEAYRELANAGLVEPAGAVVSFFGDPKSLYRLSSTSRVREGAA